MATYKTTGALMLGTRLRRLSDAFLLEISRIYRSLGIEFEAPWFPVFYLLRQHGSISISLLAGELEVSQSAVSQMIVQLEKRGLIQVARRDCDRRVRYVSLTDSGKELLAQVLPVWKEIQQTVEGMMGDDNASRMLLHALEQFEGEMERTPMSEAVLARLSNSREAL